MLGQAARGFPKFEKGDNLGSERLPTERTYIAQKTWEPKPPRSAVDCGSLDSDVPSCLTLCHNSVLSTWSVAGKTD